MAKFFLFFTKYPHLEQLPPKEVEVKKDTIRLGDLDEPIKNTAEELAKEHRINIEELHLSAISDPEGNMLWYDAHAT